MYHCEVQEAKALVFKIGEMLDQVGQLAGEETDVARTLGATRYQLEELDAALWYVEPQADDSPVPDTVGEKIL